MMYNKEMTEYKENLISKLKRFFKNLFSKKKTIIPRCKKYI